MQHAIIMFNQTKNWRDATASSNGGAFEIEGNPGDIIEFGVQVDSVQGAPTAASLTAKIQLAPIQFASLDFDAVSNSIGRTWYDVTTGGSLANLLLDGDFPSPIVDQTIGNRTAPPIVRRVRLTGQLTLARLLVTATFTGGTSPKFVHSVFYNQIVS